MNKDSKAPKVEKENEGNVPLSPYKYEESLNSSTASLNSNMTGLVIGLSKAAPSVSATNTVTMGESPETNAEMENGFVSNIRSLATGSSTNGADVLTHRRSKKKQHTRSISTGSAAVKSLPQLPNTPKAPSGAASGEMVVSPSSISTTDFDRTLYVDELYLDTQYRFASEKRNEDFHALFTSVPKDDRLLDDFSCALNKEILLQGRIYISEHYLCFYSSIFGWVTTNPMLVLSHDEITKFEKRSTAGLFPNGIAIQTKEASHTFASFLARDQTLNFIETIWSKSLALSKLNNESPRDVEIDISPASMRGLSEQDIFTIDGDSQDSSGEDGSNFESDDDSKAAIVQGDETPMATQTKSFASESRILGPDKHKPTQNPVDYTVNKEKVVLEATFDAPLGLLYKLYFGNDTSYHRKVLELSDGSNFTEYGGLEDEKQRTFEFDKGLNYPIGPKSTRVYMEEKVENFDFEDYVEIVSITKTPNVPSGGVFDCRTRYVFTWAEQNKTKLYVSYYLNWTGSSWIKGVIESSTQSGQQKAGDDVKVVLEEALELQQKQNKTSKPRKTKSKAKSKTTPVAQPSAPAAGVANESLVLGKMNTIVRGLALVVFLELIIIMVLVWGQYQTYMLCKT